MKKLLSIIATICIGFALPAYADKPVLNVVMAGSPSGTFNSFNKELVKDLEKHYDITTIPGQSELKGVGVFNKVNGPVYVMVRSGMLNAKLLIKEKDPIITNISPKSMVMALGYYKTFCVNAGESVDYILFSNNRKTKIGFSDGITVSTKFLDNLNRVTNSKNIMVPYKGSGASVKGVIIGEIMGVMVTEAKTLKYINKGQISCKYSTNINSKFAISKKLNDNWFGWSYGNLIFGHTRNMSTDESTHLHNVITEILTDPTTNAGKKARKNMWDIKLVDQLELYLLYTQSKVDTLNLLK